MARFVVLRHDCPRGLHWDFMLAAAGALRTWALALEPTGSFTCWAERLPDHRPVYLDYEGEISGGRGRVTRYDLGEYQLRKEDAQELVVELHGARLRGTAALTRESGGQRWRFSFAPAGTAANGLTGAGAPSDSRETVQPATNNSSSLS